MMKPQAYKVLRARELNGTVYARVGDIVYDCKSHDYGTASDDTRAFGIQHTSVSSKEDGDYPFFTIPLRDLEKLP